MKKTAVIILLLALTLCAAAYAEQGDIDEPVYEINEWGYVDGSMDVSQGIPENAQGVLADIRDRGVLRVATEPYYPPQEFIDNRRDGQSRYVGADMELARLIARRMGVRLEIVPMDFTLVLDAVADGECDLAISALSYTPARAQRMTLSRGYYYTEDAQAGTGLLVRAADADEITGLADLSGRNIAAQSGSVQELLAAENVSDYREFRRTQSVQDTYKLLSSGWADAVFIDMDAARLYLMSEPECGFAIVDGVRFDIEEAQQGDRIAARRGELQLIYFVNGVIEEVLQERQYNKWYDEYEIYAASME